MAKGRKPARHAAVSELRRKDALAGPLGDLEVAIDRWIGGGSVDDVDAAIDNVVGALDASRGPGVDPNLPPEDKLAWTAVRYRQATRIASILARVAQTAASFRDDAMAELVEAHAVPPPIPRYGVTFVKGLIAEGAGQADLHPATRRRTRATLRVLREIAPNGNDGAPATHLLPPVRSWADLPRKFAGYELVDVPADDVWVAPAPLPPHTDIARYTPDRMAPTEGETRLDTYKQWDRIIRTWVAENNKSTGATIYDVSGATSLAWLLLLGHRLEAPDQEPFDKFNGVQITSPWAAKGVVKPVWIGRQAQD